MGSSRTTTAADYSSSSSKTTALRAEKNDDQCSRSRTTAAAAESVGGGSCSCCFLANRVWQPASAACHYSFIHIQLFLVGVGPAGRQKQETERRVCSILPRLLAFVGYDRTAAAGFGGVCKAARQLRAVNNEGNVFDAPDRDCLLMLLGCGVSRDEELVLMTSDLTAEAHLVGEGLSLHLWMLDICNLACGSLGRVVAARWRVRAWEYGGQRGVHYGHFAVELGGFRSMYRATTFTLFETECGAYVQEWES